MSRMRAEKNGNGAKYEVTVWTRAITANSEWPDKVNITLELSCHSITSILFYPKGKEIHEAEIISDLSFLYLFIPFCCRKNFSM